MSKIKTLLLTSALALAFVAPSFAQFQPTPSNPSRNSTYRAGSIVTTAASATDIFTLKGSASKVITVTNVECNGLATTAAVANLLLVKRSVANSGGTSTAPAAVPANSTLPAATAALAAYTANPTVGAIVGNVGIRTVGLPLLTGAAAGGPANWDLVSNQFSYPIVLNGVAQSLSVNGNGATLGTGATLGCTFTWTES